MTTIQKAKLLHQLYQYRSMGFSFIKENRPVETASESTSLLPDSIEAMKPMVQSCHLCDLAKGRKHVVFGEGNPQARLMFVGEGPGTSEDETGRPFVGRTGELLNKIIQNVLGLQRSDVYITNIVKCRPAGNRVPNMDEVDACKPYLLRQIELVKPEIIVALGSTSYHHLTGEYETPIAQVRGEILTFGDAKLIPTFHPSFLLRNPSAKKEVFHDMLKVKSLL